MKVVNFCLLLVLHCFVIRASLIYPFAGRGENYGNDGFQAIEAQVSPRDVYYYDNELYFCEDNFGHRVRKITREGIVDTVAGSARGYFGDGGTALEAQFDAPTGIFVVNDQLYIADSSNNRVRKVDLKTKIVTTIAGTGTVGSSGDGGLATSARLFNPRCVTVQNDEIYICDTFNHKIRKILINGTIITVAGTGSNSGGLSGDGNLATQANLNFPNAVRFHNNDMYITDEGNHAIRKVSEQGIITTVVGTGSSGYNGDGIQATSAQLSSPNNILFMGNDLLVSDVLNYRVRRIFNNGTISTMIGNGISGHSPNNTQANEAQLVSPRGLAVIMNSLVIADGNFVKQLNLASSRLFYYAGDGNTPFSRPIFLDNVLAAQSYMNGPRGICTNGDIVYITDTNNHRIRKIENGFISTIAGTGEMGLSGNGGLAINAALRFPFACTIHNNNLYFLENSGSQIRMINSSHHINLIGGSDTAGFSGDGGPAINAQFEAHNLFAYENDVYVVEQRSARIRKIDYRGIVNTTAGTGNRDYNGEGLDALQTNLNGPSSIAVYQGMMIISEALGHRLRAILPNNTIITVAGDGFAGFAGEGEHFSKARFDSISNVKVWKNELYIADESNYRVRKIFLNGTIATIIGNGQFGNSGDFGAATSAQIGFVEYFDFDLQDRIYLAFAAQNRIRVVSNIPPPVPAVSIVPPPQAHSMLPPHARSTLSPLVSAVSTLPNYIQLWLSFVLICCMSAIMN